MRALLLGTIFAAAPMLGLADNSTPCPRFNVGSDIIEPESLYSQPGRLELTFKYQTRLDSNGNTLYCFTSADGAESPTLHVYPGDELIIHLKNEQAPGAAMVMSTMPEMAVARTPAESCETGPMTSTSVNIHYHGTNTPPLCHQDEVIHTTVDGGQSFDYDVHFPSDEPPGLYWVSPSYPWDRGSRRAGRLIGCNYRRGAGKG